MSSTNQFKMKHSLQIKESSRSILFNFSMMSIFFSINHGTVLACISLATSEFGSKLGSYSLGSVYLMYTLSSMFFSTTFIDKFGEKWTMAIGLWIYCFYVISYLIAKALPSIEWYIVLTGSIMGGFSAGVLWTAQGGYFSNCAKQYATLKGIERTEATSFMSAFFATMYLAFEVFIRMLSSFLQIFVCADEWQGNFITGECSNNDLEEKSKILVYIVYTIAAIVSSLGMCFVRNINAPKEIKECASQEDCKFLLYGAIKEVGEDSVSVDKSNILKYSETLMTLRLLLENRKMQLMVLVNVSYGFTSAYLNSYVTEKVITDNLGESKVGYFTSIIPLVAAISSFPISWINNYFGSKRYTMVLGSVCLASFSLLFLLYSSTYLRPWTALVLLFSMYGVGRAVWEGTNKAVFADFFSRKSSSCICKHSSAEWCCNINSIFFIS